MPVKYNRAYKTVHLLCGFIYFLTDVQNANQIV